MVATQAEKDALKVMRKGTRACRECIFLISSDAQISNVLFKAADERSNAFMMTTRKTAYVRSAKSITGNVPSKVSYEAATNPPVVSESRLLDLSPQCSA